jgi:hypothetical protein
MKIDASTKKTKSDVGCFICGRPYYARGCPKMEKLNAILANDNEHEETVVITQFLTLYFSKCFLNKKNKKIFLMYLCPFQSLFKRI